MHIKYLLWVPESHLALIDTRGLNSSLSSGYKSDTAVCDIGFLFVLNKILLRPASQRCWLRVSKNLSKAILVPKPRGIFAYWSGKFSICNLKNVAHINFESKRYYILCKWRRKRCVPNCIPYQTIFWVNKYTKACRNVVFAHSKRSKGHPTDTAKCW